MNHGLDEKVILSRYIEENKELIDKYRLNITPETFDRGFERELKLYELAVSENQGILFQDCEVDFDVDAKDFVEKFMSSEIAANMDKDYSLCQIWGTKQLGETLLETVDIKRFAPGGGFYDPDVLYWMGYMYRYWTWWLGTPSKDIIQIIPFDRAFMVYPGYHTLSVKGAVDMFRRANTEKFRQFGVLKQMGLE